MRRTLIPIALLVPIAAMAGWGLGDEIAPSLALDVTDEGFESLGGLASEIVPDALPVDPIYMGDKSETCTWVGCVTWWEYSLAVTNIDIGMAVDQFRITPKWDALEMYAQAIVEPGTPASPIVIELDAGIPIFDISQTCHAWVDPVTVELGGEIQMDVKTDGAGDRYLDATIPPGLLWWSWNMTGDKLQFEAAPGRSCVLNDIEDFFDWLNIGINIFDLILDQLIPVAADAIDDIIDDLSSEIEPVIEDLFSSANIEEEVELGDATMTIKLEPSDVVIEPAGMRIEMAGSFDTPMHPCVIEYGVTESIETSGVLPTIETPIGVSDYDVGIFVADDFVNQGLYAAWAGGLLCQTITEGEGLPINTTLLSLLSAEAFGPLFPETQPIVIQTRPKKVLELDLTGPHAIDIPVRELGLDFYGDIDYRATRVLGGELETDVGVDINFDDTTGELLVDIDLDPAEMDIKVVHNEYAPEYTAELEDQFGDLVDTVVGPMIGGLISDIRFGLPAIEGLGLTSLDVENAGPSADFLGMYANAGPVTYEAGSCDDMGDGCGGGGCAGVPASPIAVFGFPILLALFRRRQDK